MKHQLKNNYEYKKIIIIKNIKKSLIKKSTSTINTENIIQKKEKHDENLKNQNIMLKKKISLTYQFIKFRKDKNVLSIKMHRHQNNKNMS